jgi:prevent-host-death family protein
MVETIDLRESPNRATVAKMVGGCMKEVNSTEFKKQFGEWLSLSRDEPIAVSRSGKAVAVLLSAGEYEYLQNMEDLYWVARAQAAEAAGEWIGHEQAVKLLTERLQRPQ